MGAIDRKVTKYSCQTEVTEINCESQSKFNKTDIRFR